jgi:hypothetical protein
VKVRKRRGRRASKHPLNYPLNPREKRLALSKQKIN